MKIIDVLNSKRATFELAALFIFILVLVANLVLIRFTEGYFEFFGVPMSEVNYAPQMYDYLRIALPVIAGSIVVTIIFIFLTWLTTYVGDFLARLTKQPKWAVQLVERHQKYFKMVASVLDVMTKIGILAACLWLFWVALYSVTATLGGNYARNTTQMTSISKTGDNLQKLIIYKGANELILKTFDVSKKEFVDGYSVVNGTDYDARRIDL